MALRARPRWDRRAVDPKLHQFVALLHRPAPPPPRREIVRRAATCAAGLLIVAAVGALLWFPWPGLNSFFKPPTAPALIVALPPAEPDPPVQPTVSALPEPISVAHAEPARVVPPPAPPAPESEQVLTSLPPQEAPRLLAAQPPLPPVPSLPPPVSPVAAVVPAPPPPTTTTMAVQHASAGTPAWIRNAVPVPARYGVPHAGRDVFLDDEMSSPAIQAQLAELERVARRNGSAIAIGHPHDATLDALKTWLRDAPGRCFVLVPVSAIVKERAGEG